MSTKSSYIWSRNFLQSNLNKKPLAKTICNFQAQQPLQIQQSKENLVINSRRKLYKTANCSKRYGTSQDKFKCHKCMPNNRTRPTPTTKRNLTTTAHFNANLLWRRTGLGQGNQNKQPSTKSQNEKERQNNQNHNLHMNCKCSVKLVNQQYRQSQLNHSRQPFQHHLEKDNTHKTNHIACETFSSAFPNNKTYKCIPCVHVLPRKMDKNHYHLVHLRNGFSNLLQLHDVLSNVSSSTTQLSKCHYDEHNPQLTWLPQVLPQQEHLLGMFEVLPPLFLLKSIPGLDAKHQHQHQHHWILESIKHQCHAFQPKTQSLMEHFNQDNGRVFKNSQTKSKPSDRDVIFGNACLFLSKRYGWETSRIEWLLQLEQKNQAQNKKRKKGQQV